MFKHVRFVLCVILVALLGACGTPASPGPTRAPTIVLPTRVPLQPSPNAQNSAQNNVQPTAVAAQPTAAPTTIATRPPASPTLIPASPTRSFATATPKVVATATQPPAAAGDATRGEALFKNGIGDPAVPTCLSCHVVDTDEIKVGPSQKGVATHGIPHAQAQGQDLAIYFHTSIVNPNAFLVPNPEGHVFSINGTSIMYQDYAKHLTEQQINDLVAYLLTLK
jgi:cytochrome c551/c552